MAVSYDNKEKIQNKNLVNFPDDLFDNAYELLKLRFLYLGLIATAALRMNDFDPPAPPDIPVSTPTSGFMSTVYSRTFYNNINRMKEAYFDDKQACENFVASNLEDTKGVLDVNIFDSGKCYPLSAEMSDPQIATTHLRNLIGNYQFSHNIKTRNFASPETCANYIEQHLKEMAGTLDINMFDSASCHSVTTGQATAYAENRFFGGVKLSRFATTPTNQMNMTATEIEYIGTTYLRNIFGNVSREKIASLKNKDACTAFVTSQLIEASHTFDLNFADSGTCYPKKGAGTFIEINSQFFGAPKTRSYIPAH